MLRMLYMGAWINAASAQSAHCMATFDSELVEVMKHGQCHGMYEKCSRNLSRRID